MKKLILPLLLLVAFGMLAAVESDPSNIVGYVKYDLVVGNTAIALPMVQTYALASEVGNAIPGCGTVSYYNASTQLWVPANKSPFGIWSPNFAVGNGMPLVVNTTTAGAFYSIGDLPDPLPSYSLLVGNNAIMIPLDKSNLNMASLVGNSITGCGTVSYYNSATQLWVPANKSPFGIWSPDFATEIADPLLVNTTAAGTWPSAKLSK